MNERNDTKAVSDKVILVAKFLIYAIHTNEA